MIQLIKQYPIVGAIFTLCGKLCGVSLSVYTWELPHIIIEVLQVVATIVTILVGLLTTTSLIRKMKKK